MAIEQKHMVLEKAGPTEKASNEHLRARALIFGSAAAAITAVLVTQAEIVLSTVRIGYLQMPPAALGMLLIAIGVNRLVKRVSSRAWLSPSDMLVVYCMCLVAAMVSSHGVVQKLVPLLVIPKYYADNTNNWHQLYDPHISKYLVPYNPSNGNKQPIVEDYYNGVPRGGNVPWQAWVEPLLAWCLLIGLVLFSFLCLTAILRKQWVDNEKLAFPLAQLPLEIAGDTTHASFFRNGWMWTGFLIPVFVFGIKIVHQAQPSVPDITLQWILSKYITAVPWKTGADGIPLILSFAAIGFFFLLPTDILFSIWFFFLLTRLEVTMGTAYNMDMPGMPQFPPSLFVGYQSMGAYMVMVGYFLYIARAHLKTVWLAAIGRSNADDSQELMPYRFAVWGLFGGIVGSALWLCWAGMSPWLAMLELVAGIFVVGLVMARSTAEAGLLMTETTFRPVDIYQLAAPLHSLGPANLTLLVFMDSLFLRDQRGLLLCGFLDSIRIADGTQIPRRAFAKVLFLGVAVALVVAVALNIALPYHIGALKMDPWLEQGNSHWMFADTSALRGNETASGTAVWQRPTFFGVGVAMALFLTLMRAAYFWWPLHPLGYALAGSWSTVQFWFPCLLAWILKSMSLRYGGMSFYVKARPVFLGMVLGEFGMAILSVLLNIFFHVPAPEFPWN